MLVPVVEPLLHLQLVVQAQEVMLLPKPPRKRKRKRVNLPRFLYMGSK